MGGLPRPLVARTCWIWHGQDWMCPARILLPPMQTLVCGECGGRRDAGRDKAGSGATEGANCICGQATNCLLWAGSLPSESISADGHQTGLNSPLPKRLFISSCGSLESVITAHGQPHKGSQAPSLLLRVQPAAAPRMQDVVTPASTGNPMGKSPRNPKPTTVGVTALK